MGKSIRSKRKKRLRTLKRDIVEPHYAAKDTVKLAIAAAALAAPKVELPKKLEDMEDESVPSRGRSRVPVSAAPAETRTPMAIDDQALSSSTPSNLKATGGIRKRGKSKKGHRSKQILRGKRKKGVGF